MKRIRLQLPRRANQNDLRKSYADRISKAWLAALTHKAEAQALINEAGKVLTADEFRRLKASLRETD